MQPAEAVAARNRNTYHNLRNHGRATTSFVLTPGASFDMVRLHVSDVMTYEQSPTALESFVSVLQVQIGRVPATDTHALRELFLPVIDALPQNLTGTCFYVLRSLLTQTILRLHQMCVPAVREKDLATTLLQLCSAQDVIALSAEFSSYLSRIGAPDAPPAGRDRRVAKAISYIKENSHRSSLSLGEVAEAVRLSTWHLDRLLRQRSGSCYREHLLRARIEHALRLLDEAEMSIKEISAAVGYSYLSEFDRRFKQVLKMTPSQWRSRFASADDP